TSAAKRQRVILHSSTVGASLPSLSHVDTNAACISTAASTQLPVLPVASSAGCASAGAVIPTVPTHLPHPVTRFSETDDVNMEPAIWPGGTAAMPSPRAP